MRTPPIDPVALAAELSAMPVTGRHAALRELYGAPALVLDEPQRLGGLLAVLADVELYTSEVDPGVVGQRLDFAVGMGLGPHADALDVHFRYSTGGVPGCTAYGLSAAREAEDRFAVFVDPEWLGDAVAILTGAGDAGDANDAAP